MKTRLLIGSITALFLYGCGETTAVLECSIPTVIDVSSEYKVEGKLSVKKAQGAINTSIGKGLKAEFSVSDPNSWMSIASTYQYQTCQFINSTSCDDLSESECLDKKNEILNKAFEKINSLLKTKKDELAHFEKAVSTCIE